MPFEPRLFSGADGNIGGSAPGNLAGPFDRAHYADPAAAETAHPATAGFSTAKHVDGIHSGERNHVDRSATSPSPSTAKERDIRWLRPVTDEADCDAELELPDQLAMLAAQLRDEADTLAAQHAPPEVQAVAPIADRRRLRFVWRYAAIALVGLGLVAWRSLAVSHQTPSNVDATSNDAITRDAVSAKTNLSAQMAKSTVGRLGGAVHNSATKTVAALNKPASSAGADPQALRAGQGIQEVSAGDGPVARHPPADETEMLRRQVEGFDKLIHRLQAELTARDAAQVETEKLIQSLRQENEQLRRQQRVQNQ